MHRGLCFEIYRGPAYLRRFSRSPKKSVQPNLDSTCFKHRGNFHAWPGSLKHVETDNLTLNLKSTPSVMVSVVKVQKTCVACGGGEYGLIVFVEDDAAPVV